MNKRKRYNRIKAVLVDKDIDRALLAEELGMHIQSINAILNNRTQPSIPKLFKIADILEVQPRQLLVEVDLSKDRE